MTENLNVNLVENIIPECLRDSSILLIDNDTISVTSLTSMLKQFSYKVMSVNVASEAVSMIEQQKDIGLIIANIEMAHIDSHCFLDALVHKEIPLILISPEINTKEASDLLTKRACFSLKKPISENDIKNMWQHVVSKKSQALEKISIAEQQEKVTGNSILTQIEAFRETIKKQRTSQSSLLGKRPFIKKFTTPETYQKRKIIANDETENKREEEKKLESNAGRRCNLWTRERHMRFLAAISILGEKDSRPKAILKIMNDSNLNHRQVGSHLQKYKSQVQRINDTLPRNESRSTDETFEYPSDYEYPFKASDLKKNLIECNSLWHSLRKKKFSSSSSIFQYSFKKFAAKRKAAKTPKFHLGGKLDLSKYSHFGNVLNKPSMKVNSVPSATSNNPPYNIPPSTNDVNHSGLSSDNPPVLSGIPSSVGASNLDAFQMESVRVGIPQSDPNPLQPSSSILETDMNQLGLDPIYIPDSYVPQADLSINPLETNMDQMGEGYFLRDYSINPLETNMDQMGWVPPVENYSHHESNMNQIDWNPSTENYVLPETDMNITVPKTNTNHMGWVYSGEDYVTSEHMIPPEINMNQMGRVSSGGNYDLSQDMIFHESNTNPVGFVSGETSHEIPLETNTNQMDWLFSEECLRLLEDMTSFETNTTQVGLENVIPLETTMEETGLVPYVRNNYVPIEDLISFDIDVNEMEIEAWLENYNFFERNNLFPTSYSGHDSAFNTPMDSIPHTTMEDQDQSLGMTSQQHNMMESFGYQNMEAANPRDQAMEGGDLFDYDLGCMDWIDEMLNQSA